MTTTKTTKTMYTEMMRRTAAYGVMKDDVDDDVEVRDGGDGWVPIGGEG